MYTLVALPAVLDRSALYLLDRTHSGGDCSMVQREPEVVVSGDPATLRAAVHGLIAESYYWAAAGWTWALKCTI